MFIRKENVNMITEELKLKLEKKIEEDASFLSCVWLTQKILGITLKEAKELLLEFDVYSDERKTHIVESINLMQSEYKEK